MVHHHVSPSGKSATYPPSSFSSCSLTFSQQTPCSGQNGLRLWSFRLADQWCRTVIQPQTDLDEAPQHLTKVKHLILFEYADMQNVLGGTAIRYSACRWRRVVHFRRVRVPDMLPCDRFLTRWYLWSYETSTMIRDVPEKPTESDSQQAPTGFHCLHPSVTDGAVSWRLPLLSSH